MKHATLGSIVTMTTQGATWQADCLCGWRGPIRATIGRAERDQDQHETDVRDERTET